MRDFFKRAGTAIKNNLPSVVQNYPYASGVLFLAGAVVLALIQWVR